MTLAVTATDADSGVKGYAVTTEEKAPALDSFTADVPKADHNGVYYIWAADKAGNISAAEKVNVTALDIVPCALPGFVDSKNEEKTERNAGYLVVSQSGGGMLRQGTRKGIRRTPANRGMRAHRIVKGLDISEDVCHGMCP